MIVKNFFLLSLVSILSAVMFYFFVDWMCRRNVERELYETNMNTLAKTGETVYGRFVGFAQMMNITIHNKEFISATINPNTDFFDQNKSIISSLGILSAGSALIRNAGYYIPATGYVYTSWGTMEKREDFAHAAALEHYLAGNRSWMNIPKTSLSFFEDRIFLFQDFFTVKRLGIMFIEIDLEILAKLIRGSDAPFSGNIYAYGPGMKKIFRDSAYPPAAQGELLDALQMSENNMIRVGNTSYYSYIEPNCNWIYILSSHEIAYSLGQRLALRVVIPFLFFFLIINLSVYLYSTLSLYYPVHRIISSIVDSSKPDGLLREEAKNEFDFINSAYHHVVVENKEYGELVEQYGTLVSKLAPNVLERLLSKLLSGREVDGDYVMEALKSIGSRFADAGNIYVTSVIRFVYASPLPGEMDLDRERIRLEEKLNEVVLAGIGGFWLLDRNYDMVMIIHFGEDTTSARISRLFADIRSFLGRYETASPCRIYLGYGEKCSSILDIRYSYEEALADLRSRQYIESGRTAAAFAEQPEREEGGLRRLEHVWRHLHDGESEKARAAATKIVSEIFDRLERTEDSCAVWESCTKLANAFVEKMIELRIPKEDLAHTERNLAELEAGGYEHSAMISFSAAGIALIDQHYRKKQNKYIVAATEYIAEHYSNSDLSLNTVSEHLGIHSSYLSRLFGESSGKNFTTVLNDYRTETARSMLTATRLSITEIGFKTGFNSVQNFIRVFKKHVGLTPGQYREQNA